MNKRLFVPCMLLSLILESTLHSQQFTDVKAASFIEQKTLVLYDAASGAIPSEALMDFTDFPPGAASTTYVYGVTIMDTSLSGTDTFAGWVSGPAITSGFPVLDRTAGIQVSFTLQLDSEMHTRNHRAGFNLILLDQNAKGIELAFWENEIWAQNDDRTGGMFTHGEGIAFSTTAGLADYQLTMIEDTYTLTASSQVLLSGPVRDYSPFEGFPDPYETPNFLFFGDNSTSAQARVRLRTVSITGTEPALPAITNTGTSTSNSQPTASFTPPPPSVIPLPSPTPAPTRIVVELASSGWLVLAVTLAGVTLGNKIRGRYIRHS
jgi:hypothetical protein